MKKIGIIDDKKDITGNILPNEIIEENNKIEIIDDSNKVNILEYFTTEELSTAVGYNNPKVLAVTDEGIVKQILKISERGENIWE